MWYTLDVSKNANHSIPMTIMRSIPKLAYHTTKVTYGLAYCKIVKFDNKMLISIGAF